MSLKKWFIASFRSHFYLSFTAACSAQNASKAITFLKLNLKYFLPFNSMIMSLPTNQQVSFWISNSHVRFSLKNYYTICIVWMFPCFIVHCPCCALCCPEGMSLHSEDFRSRNPQIVSVLLYTVHRNFLHYREFTY